MRRCNATFNQRADRSDSGPTLASHRDHSVAYFAIRHQSSTGSAIERCFNGARRRHSAEIDQCPCNRRDAYALHLVDPSGMKIGQSMHDDPFSLR